MSDTPRVDALAELMKRTKGKRDSMTVWDCIEEIDKMLFDAGVLVLSAKTNASRQAADRKIMEARVRLESLRPRLT